MEEVTLGLPGPWAEDYREKSDHYTTKIGGIPDWPFTDSNFAHQYQSCKLCGKIMFLVAQVYVPINLPKLNIEDRVIYILGCLSPSCSSNPHSLKALRVQKYLNKCAGEEKAPIDLDSSAIASTNKCSMTLNFFNDSDDEYNFTNLQELSDKFSKFAIMASDSKKGANFYERCKPCKKYPSTKIIDQDSDIPALPCFYVYFEKESSSCGDNTSSDIKTHSVKEIQVDSSRDEGEEKWESENYEYDHALGADRVYLKFKRKMDLNPMQCIRYSYGAKPLVAKKDMEEPKNCEFCGSLRRFEMQLMPPLLYFLQQDFYDSSSSSSSNCLPEDWSWLTLILYTCSKSCFPIPSTSEAVEDGGGYWVVAEEAIIVQDD